MMLRKLPFIFLSIVMSSQAFALDDAKTNINKTNENQTEIDQLVQDKFEQKFWGLDDKEWSLYKKIKPIAVKLGKTPVSSTPPEILGIFAKTEAERRKYAQLFAIKLDLYTKNTLAWGRSLSQIHKTMYAGIPMLDPNKLNRLRGTDFSTSDRIQFFTKLNDCDSCEVQLRKLIRQVRLYGMTLDVFFNDESITEMQIADYADKHIPKEEMIKGKITLNQDNGFVKKHKLTVPVAYISQNNGPLENHDPDM